MNGVDIRLLSSLADSLKARHFHDRETFIRTYGEAMWEKFGGMMPLVKKFLEELEHAIQS